MIQTALQKIHLKNFRCFTSQTIEFEEQIILLEGINGSGKTSLLEALHYTCYLRSFRTHLSRDLIKFGSEGFFIQTTFNDQTIAIGCTGVKKHIKVNQKTISSYKELRENFKIITVTEDDVGIVKESPEKRRAFLDHALLLEKPELLETYKTYRTYLKNRNALLFRHTINYDELVIWTKKLWELSCSIQKERRGFLSKLESSAHEFLSNYWQGDCRITFEYQAKKISKDSSWIDFEAFWKVNIMEREKQMRRSLFGSHLDDFLLSFNGKPARLYSSRGQQKLIVLLLKIAQVQSLKTNLPGGITFLLDDFMTDFDPEVAKKVINACLSLNIQLIFTSPLNNSLEKSLLKDYTIQTVNISAQ